MGCAASVPAAKPGDVNLDTAIHTADPNIPFLGQDLLLPTTTSKAKKEMIAREQIFSCTDQDSIAIKQVDGTPFCGLRVNLRPRDTMVLVGDPNTKQPIAIILRELGADAIFTLSPLFKGQAPYPSETYGPDDQPLYVHAVVVRKWRRFEVRFGSEPESAIATPSFTIRSTKKCRTVENRQGVVVAMIERGYERIPYGPGVNAHCISRITTCSGMDPCLVLLLAAICDEQEERRKLSFLEDFFGGDLQASRLLMLSTQT
jgi:hypothetical protein